MRKSTDGERKSNCIRFCMRVHAYNACVCVCIRAAGIIFGSNRTKFSSRSCLAYRMARQGTLPLYTTRPSNRSRLREDASAFPDRSAHQVATGSSGTINSLAR